MHWRSLLVAMFFMTPITAFAESVFVENLTWREIQTNIARGKTTAIYYAGSTEQNGPHMATGKHNVIARYVAEQIARKLGNALIYPILPYAPTGDPEKKTDHMRFPGSVSLNDATFGAIARDVAFSARAAGFRNVVLMGDHGGGQQALKSVAEELNAKWAPDGIRVFYIPDLYYRSLQLAEEELRSHGLKDGNHAGIIDTSELLFVDHKRKFIRVGKIAAGSEANGVDGDPRRATRQLGKRFVSFKIDSAESQIRMLTQE
jgi:creatinine amidohydrolase/Fe(II)-dependent formamide hydrolase-like protein